MESKAERLVRPLSCHWLDPGMLEEIPNRCLPPGIGEAVKHGWATSGVNGVG